MGSCASSDGDKGKQRPNDDPELMGKAKFLSCPSLSEITDPSQAKWLLIVFAPLTHHGLIFAARNAKDGTLLVKDIVDKQVAKEKEEQRVQLSYNLFFKAISTEVAKASRSGAKVEWLSDGSLSVECKIAISGSASSNKKPDTYTACLKRVDGTEANLFKYIAEPLATHYCKKRTDGWNLDRPDPHKEKMYGEQEASAIMRSASMRASQHVLDKELPNITPMRQEHATARAERDAALAKVNLMKQMLVARSVNPPLLRLPPEDAFASLEPVDLGLNPMAAAMEPHFAFPKPADVGTFTSRPQDPPSSSVEVVFDSTATTLPTTFAVYHVGYAAFKEFELVDSDRSHVNDAALRHFLYRVDGLHRGSNAFHNAARAAERLHAFAVLLKRAMSRGFAPDPHALTAALVAAVIHDADHCGLNNQQGTRSRFVGYVPTLYSYQSPVERHSLAVGLSEALNASLAVDSDCVASIVLSTDLAKHQEFMTRFSRRSREIADFSRTYDDQLVAFGALLKTADLCHMYKDRRACDTAMAALASEVKAGCQAAGVPEDTPPDLNLFAKHVALPLFSAVATAFPALKFVKEGGDEVLSG